jgi:hypothetical protein
VDRVEFSTPIADPTTRDLVSRASTAIREAAESGASITSTAPGFLDEGCFEFIVTVKQRHLSRVDPDLQRKQRFRGLAVEEDREHA